MEPAFDPNNPYVLDPTTQLRIDSIVDENAREEARNEALQYMWSNKAVTDTYYPGSVFKIFTAAMGLEEGVVKTTDTFYCSGVMQVEEWAIHCHVRRGHGQETFVKGVLNSCNPVFMTENVYDAGNGRKVGAGGVHLKLDLIQESQPYHQIAAIAFNMAEYYDYIKSGNPLDVCYSIVENYYRGNSTIQLRVKDLREREELI